MRLNDLVTPELLEKVLHMPILEDRVEALEAVKSMQADQKSRLAYTKPLADVLYKCTHQCGPFVNGVSAQNQAYIQHMALTLIDAAIELAAKDTA